MQLYLFLISLWKKQKRVILMFPFFPHGCGSCFFFEILGSCPFGEKSFLYPSSLSEVIEEAFPGACYVQGPVGLSVILLGLYWSLLGL